jgi:Zn-dependent M28 family amino/carboxypeptidase
MFRFSVLATTLLFVQLLGSFAFATDWSSARSVQQIQLNSKAAPDPVYQRVFNSVDKSQLIQHLQQLAGVVPVNVGNTTYSITNRYLPESKAKFRAFWTQYFKNLGMSVKELPYTTAHSIGETEGHNVEAVLPGQLKDSVVVIVHYDSIGPDGQESSNPGVDDDMTGMSIMLETARILSKPEFRNHLKYTVRFVAADYEEFPSPGLEGARNYASYLQNLAKSQNFKIIGAVDNEQSGWNCINDNACDAGTNGPTVDTFTCSGDSNNFNYPALGDLFNSTVAAYSKLAVSAGCMGENSDHYAMWEIGVPAFVYSEHNPFSNDHFDQSGGDTFDKIDQNYFFSIAQVGVTFAARLINLN